MNGFKPQISPSNCIFKENKILQISGFVSYKYDLLKNGKLRDLQRYIYLIKPKLQPQTTRLVLLQNIFLLYLRSKHITLGLTLWYLHL